MKLSKQTLDILKNFSGINPGIVIKPGNYISSKSESSTIIAEANVEDTFPHTVALYDINQFLGTLSEFGNPDIEFGEQLITIREGKSSFQGRYASESMITQYTKKLNMPETVINFNLSQDDLGRLLSMANIQNLKTIAVTKNEEDKIILVALDIDNNSEATFTIETDSDAPSGDFKMLFDKSNLKFVKGDYAVGIAREGIAQFVNQNVDVTYSIATLDKSYFK
jgi:hypothetical protein